MTPEYWSDEESEALHILNISVADETQLERAICFAAGRAFHFAKHLPTGSKQRVRFDLRGQTATDLQLKKIRDGIARLVNNLSGSVAVEFHTD